MRMISCRSKLKWHCICKAQTVLLASRLATASNVLVLSVPGMRSHHMNMVMISEELHVRMKGHNVSVLISASDEIGQNVLATRGLPGFHTIEYIGAMLLLVSQG